MPTPSSPPTSPRALALIGLVVAFIAGITTAAPAQQTLAPKTTATFRDGMAQIVPGFADTTEWIRERIWVETDFDTDNDGKKDRIHVDITRSALAAREGTRLPVIMESSPYFGGTNSPASFLWDVKQELGVEPPQRASRPERPFNPEPRHLGARLAQQWVPRGFAVVASEQPGTGLSTGCPTVGDTPETTAPKFVIDWLNGRAKGYTTVDGSDEVHATSWATGKVGMIGTSYEGTLPISAALTGVEGLEAIVPIAPNTSYYHYYRSNGLVRSPGGWLGEDIDFLYDFVHSGRSREACNAIWRDGLFPQHRDRAHGDFSDFWEARDQLPLATNIKAAVWFAHGFNDWNVVPEHTIRMWDAIKDLNPKAKLYLHQGGHGGGPPADSVNKFWSHYLYGIDNGIDRSARVLIVPSAGTPPTPAPGAATPPPGRGGRGGAMALPPRGYSDYPIPGSAPVQVRLGKGGNGIGTLALTTGNNQGRETLIDDVQIAPATLAQAESSPNRLLYATPILTDTLHLSGTATITIQLAASKPATNLSVYLVELPFNPAAIGSAGQVGVVTRGWADPQNYRSLTRPGNYASKLPGEPLVPGNFYTLTFDLQPDDQLIVPGKQLGLMIFASDRLFTLHPEAGTELTVDLDNTSITLPVVGGEAAFRRATGR